MPSRGSSIETTTSWDGDPRSEEKRETIDIIKAKVSDRLRLLSAQRLREQPQLQWHTLDAYRAVAVKVIVARGEAGFS